MGNHSEDNQRISKNYRDGKMSVKITKKDLKALVKSSVQVRDECDKAITFMEEKIKEAKIERLTAETLIKKFG